MSPDQLAFYSSWASIIGLAVSIASLAYVRGIKANIIRFQQTKRLQQLIEELAEAYAKGEPLQVQYRGQLESLKRNLPVPRWPAFSQRSRIIIEIHRLLDEGDDDVLAEALKDLKRYLEGV